MRNVAVRLFTGTLVAGLAAVTLAACSGSSATAPSNFTMTTAKPDLTMVDVGDAGPSIGDYQVFHAVGTKDGEPFGHLYGLKLEVALPGQEGAPEGLGLFQNQLTFVLPDGDIVVEGVQYYTQDGSIPDITINEGETRAIVGGTGAYAGARGTVLTTAQEDGTRMQEFTFLP